MRMVFKKAHKPKNMRLIPAPARFWICVDKSEGQGPNGDCWLWAGHKDKDGYGVLKVNGSEMKAHRFSWALNIGPIPAGLNVLHECDTPSCVNPFHFFVGTIADNNDDRVAKGRSATGDRNGSRTYPERRPKGKTHHWQTKPETRMTGARNGRAKLTAEQVGEIRSLQGQKVNKSALGRQYGVSDTVIHHILSGKSWKDMSNV